MVSSSGDGDGEADGVGLADVEQPPPRLRRTAFGLCSELDGRSSDGRLGVPRDGRLGVCFILPPPCLRVFELSPDLS